MALSSRPWILTLLAGLNFTFAFTRFVGGLEALLHPQQAGSASTAAGVSVVYPSVGGQLTLGGLQVLAAILWALAGVGYLRRSERLGRRLGTGISVFSIALGVAMPWLWQLRGLGLLWALALLHPLVTLYILNRSHRAAFTEA